MHETEEANHLPLSPAAVGLETGAVGSVTGAAEGTGAGSGVGAGKLPASPR